MVGKYLVQNCCAVARMAVEPITFALQGRTLSTEPRRAKTLLLARRSWMCFSSVSFPLLAEFTKSKNNTFEVRICPNTDATGNDNILVQLKTDQCSCQSVNFRTMSVSMLTI